MRNKPKCTLCSGRLEREEKVTISGSIEAGPAYQMAWVCRDCSAAWPIAIKKEGVFGTKYRPLFENGSRSA